MLSGHVYELIIVLIVALVIFGPKRLLELGSSLGRGLREFRKATNELQGNMKTEEPEALPPGRTHPMTGDDVAPPRTSAAYTAIPAASTEAHADDPTTSPGPGRAPRGAPQR